MSARLISITPNAEEIILFCARVSSDQNNKDTKLINYLIKNKHWSPFEMANMIIEVEAPRFITQQILRHRSFSFQEFSQRYKKVDTSDYDIPTMRKKNKSNRQSSTITHESNLFYMSRIKNIYDEIYDLYDEMINDDVAPECARAILPLNTKSKLYINGNIRSWIHYLQVRTDEHSQQEHREIALMILDIFKFYLPNIYKAVFEENNIE